MTSFFYGRLATNNIRKNSKIYVPYVITCVITIAFFYIMKSLSLNEGILQLSGGDNVKQVLNFGSNVVGVFAVIFLFYINSFITKRREKEFGLFHILGMEKKHLSRMVGLESIYLAILSLGLGLLFGTSLDKLMYLLILRILDAQIPLGFHIYRKAIITTIIWFAVIYFLLYLNTVRKVYTFKPIQMLQSSNVGEKEPKAKWFLALLGLVCLGAGYYISLTTKNPLVAITNMFIAVLLVIFGTYFLFTAGSITLLKILRSNKRFYYKTRNFIGISGMLYRMKQNAVGLANICILSTMVLVTVSSTTALMVGVKDLIVSRYPMSYVVRVHENEFGKNYALVDELVRRVIEEKGLVPTEEQSSEYLYFSGVRNGEKFVTDMETLQNLSISESLNNLSDLTFVALDDYNWIMEENAVLNEGEVLVYSAYGQIPSDKFVIDDLEFRIAGKLDDFFDNAQADVMPTYYVVVPSKATLEMLYQQLKEVKGDAVGSISYMYGVNVEGSSEVQIEAHKEIVAGLALLEESGELREVYGESRANGEGSFYSIYTAFFFIGIFLGLIFSMATILMIYYKQISEGYYDRDRYVIMQNVGMSQEDVKSSIRAQILTVFFLPLLTAGVHVAFAYPLIEKILIVLNLSNTRLFVYSILGCYLAFTLVYIMVYSLTAKLYYAIVRK